MSVSTMVNTDGTVHVPGLPALTDNRLWHPVTVRWVTIAPSGAVEVHTSDNQVGYDAEEDWWLQWRLVLDVAAVLDPANECADHRMQVHEITDDVDGMLLEPCLRHDSSRAYRSNPVATTLIARLSGHTAQPREVRGTVVWLGYGNGDGIHASVTDARVAALREISRDTLQRFHP